MSLQFFHRNYFAAIKCSCGKVGKRSYYGFCDTLKNHSNYCAQKVCGNVDDKDSFPFEIIPFKKYLWDIKVDPFFVFDEILEYFEVLLDHPSYPIFFIANKQTNRLKNRFCCFSPRLLPMCF